MGSNRLPFCTELLQRFPNMDTRMWQLLIEAKGYYENSPSFAYRITHIVFWINHYRLLYGKHSGHLFLWRLIKYIFFY
ncbi:MAG: hypothetical protein Ta2A_26620 [Treponemataceae bacterium]|nr:MAG: hypothetical protein Ta2A_26620 [Treponemataceae bacterium]